MKMKNWQGYQICGVKQKNKNKKNLRWKLSQETPFVSTVAKWARYAVGNYDTYEEHYKNKLRQFKWKQMV